LLEKFRIGYVSSKTVSDKNSELFKIFQALDNKIDINKPIIP